MKRKNLLLFLGVLSLLGSAFTSFSQSDVAFSFGWRNHFGDMKGVNNILSQYNYTRPWLDNTMGSQNFQNGFELGIERSSEKFGGSILKYYRVWNVSSASGTTPSGEEIKRKVRTRVAGIELIDLWYTPLHIESHNFGFGVMPMALARFRVHTKLNGEKWDKIALSDLEAQGFERWASTFHAYSNLHLDYTVPLKSDFWMHLQVFASFNWFPDEYNLIYLNSQINPGTAGSSNFRQKHSQNNYGFKLMISL